MFPLRIHASKGSSPEKLSTSSPGWLAGAIERAVTSTDWITTLALAAVLLKHFQSEENHGFAFHPK